MVCKDCGAKFKSNFCPHCGAPAPKVEEKTVQTCHHICYSCGAQFDTAFCPNCGREASQEELSETFSREAHTCPKCHSDFVGETCPDCGRSATSMEKMNSFLSALLAILLLIVPIAGISTFLYFKVGIVRWLVNLILKSFIGKAFLVFIAVCGGIVSFPQISQMKKRHAVRRSFDPQKAAETVRGLYRDYPLGKYGVGVETLLTISYLAEIYGSDNHSFYFALYLSHNFGLSEQEAMAVAETYTGVYLPSALFTARVGETKFPTRLPQPVYKFSGEQKLTFDAVVHKLSTIEKISCNYSWTSEIKKQNRRGGPLRCPQCASTKLQIFSPAKGIYGDVEEDGSVYVSSPFTNPTVVCLNCGHRWTLKSK